MVEKLAEFAERFGPRFNSCDELIRRAQAGEIFYPWETPAGGEGALVENRRLTGQFCIL